MKDSFYLCELEHAHTYLAIPLQPHPHSTYLLMFEMKPTFSKVENVRQETSS